MDVTSEKFDGFAVDRYIARTVPKTPTIYPVCTLNGRQTCNLDLRAGTRQRKELLSSETLKKLNPSGTLNWKYGGYLNENSDLTKLGIKNKKSSPGTTIETTGAASDSPNKRRP
jgi:hypothetical protein